MKRTFRDTVPPRCIQRVIRSPTGDIRPVSVASAILICKRWTEFYLVIESRESGDIALPPRSQSVLFRVLNV